MEELQANQYVKRKQGDYPLSLKCRLFKKLNRKTVNKGS